MLFGSLVYVSMDHYNFIYQVKAIEAAAHQNIKFEASFWDFGSSWRKANRCAKFILSIFQVLIGFLRKFVKVFIELLKAFHILHKLYLLMVFVFVVVSFLIYFLIFY